MKKCKGCGVVLQNSDPKGLGYTPKMEADLCQRCFRIRHYDDVVISMKQGIDPNQVLQDVAKLDALILWVVDLFDVEGGMITGLNRHLQGKDIVFVGTKRDLLPVTLSDEKLVRFIRSRVRELGIELRAIAFVGDLHKGSNESVEEVLYLMETLRSGKDVAVIGMANAGKSTLLNAILNESTLTTSRHPGTTLEVSELAYDDYRLYDSPGLAVEGSVLNLADDKDLKTLIPSCPIKPMGYQLREDQSFAVGGLVRLDLFGCDKTSCVAYFSDRLKIHRGKAENAQRLWVDHLNEMLVPSLNDSFMSMKKEELHLLGDSSDIVIHGLGWFCIKGKVERAVIYTHKDVKVTVRKEML